MEESIDEGSGTKTPMDQDEVQENGLIGNDDLIAYVEEEANVAKDINENLSDAPEGLQFDPNQDVNDHNLPPSADPQFDDSREPKEDLNELVPPPQVTVATDESPPESAIPDEITTEIAETLESESVGSDFLSAEKPIDNPESAVIVSEKDVDTDPVSIAVEKEAEIVDPDFTLAEKEDDAVADSLPNEKQAVNEEPDFLASDKDIEPAEPDILATGKEPANAEPDSLATEKEADNAYFVTTESADDLVPSEKEAEECDFTDAEKVIDCWAADKEAGSAESDCLVAEPVIMEIDKDCDNTEETNPLQTSDQEDVQKMQDDAEPAYHVMDVDVEIVNEIDNESTEEKPEAKTTEEKIIFDDADSDSDVQILNLNDEEGDAAAQRPKSSAAVGTRKRFSLTSTSSLAAIELDVIHDPTLQVCAYCKLSKICPFTSQGAKYCSEDCYKDSFNENGSELAIAGDQSPRTCAMCEGRLPLANFLSWQTIDFCKISCLKQFQTNMGTHCGFCYKSISSPSLHQFCIRFGNEVKQFCSPCCLEKQKSKRCCLCHHNFSSSDRGFLSMVGNKGPFKQFCSKACVNKFHQTKGKIAALHDSCAVCGQLKPVAVEVLGSENSTSKICSEPCLAAFKFVNDVSEGQCFTCKKYFANSYSDKLITYFADKPLTFCGEMCLNIGFLAKRKAVNCSACKTKKYNFDMIKQTKKNVSALFCSYACLGNVDEAVPGTCEECGKSCSPNYKMAVDGIFHFFCSFKCATIFKNVSPSRLQAALTQIQNGKETVSAGSATTAAPAVKIVKHIVIKPDDTKMGENKGTLCKPVTHNMGTNCRPMTCVQETQTDTSLSPQMLIPVPVPIYVPAPLCMYSAPYPVPVPFPLPIPVPIFIPTTRNSSKGILKEIRKIQDKMPTDPFEAELLMMAEMVAGDKKPDVTDSESDGEVNDTAETGNVAESFSPEVVDTSNAFGEDMLQMALKMATELDEPAVDMESVLTSNTITPSSQQTVDTKTLYGAVAGVSEDSGQALNAMRGRKRSVRGGRGGGGVTPSKRGRRSGGPENTLQNISNMGNIQQPDMSQAQRIEVEKPDAHMRLKYTYGVNAWRHWVVQKNVELEKAMMRNRKIKPFKPDLLQLTADELNFSLCLFVKEVKKPNSSEYAPDTIYYLCLGIQQYLFENGRIDNIFTDSFYEKFTDCLDEVAKKFQVIFNDARYIVTRVEEEHLWESKQLGAHSPHVLLSTLMFFNTKHFNLVTVEEHMQLSFSHIMKHWKRNPNSPGVTKVPGSRNVLLRFYPPQSALEANSRKKKVYEQQENEENPLRCPVKLYEFYLSKCPESVKTRNDVFYLLPERSCVPDSPVWYSTMALGKEPLMKMLHRIKMVKEINVALLSS